MNKYERENKIILANLKVIYRYKNYLNCIPLTRTVVAFLASFVILFKRKKCNNTFFSSVDNFQSNRLGLKRGKTIGFKPIITEVESKRNNILARLLDISIQKRPYIELK